MSARTQQRFQAVYPNSALFLIAQIKQAKLEDYELPNETEQPEEFEQALNKFGAKYALSRSIALRLCDENGDLVFNPDDVQELKLISELDQKVLLDFNLALEKETPKALPSEESSN